MNRLLAAVVVFVGGACLAAGQQPALIALECRGEEPFWHVNANASAAVMKRVGEAPQPSEQTYRGTFRQFSFLDPEWAVWWGVSDDGGVLTVTTRRESCRSTMSDEPPMTHRAVIAFPDGRSATGCCTLSRGIDPNQAPIADAAAKSPEDWSRLLPNLLPAIQSCITDGNVQVRRVLKAWPMNRGMVGVRLEDVNDTELDCVAQQSNGDIDSVRPVSGAYPLPGAGNPVFLPAREQPPMVQCGRLERVVDSNSYVVGYLNYDPCRE